MGLTRKNLINDFLVIYAFSLPISRTAVSMLGMLIPLLWLCRKGIGADVRLLKKSPTFLALLGIAGFHLLSFLWTRDLTFGLSNSKTFFYWCLIPVIATRCSREDLEELSRAFIAGVTYSAAITYCIMAGLFTYRDSTPLYPSPFMSYIEFSFFLALAGLILIHQGLTLGKDLKSSRGLLKLGQIFFIVILLFSINGRSGQIGFIAGLLTLMLVHFRSGLKTFMLACGAIGMILVIAFQANPLFHQRVITTYNEISKIRHAEYDSSLGMRIGAWRVGLAMISERPLLGSGIGDALQDFQDTIKTMPRYQASAWFPHMHNQYIQTAVQVGLVGLLLCLVFFRLFLTMPLPDPATRVLRTTFVTLFLFACLGEPLWIKQLSNGLFTLFTGIYLSYSLQPTPGASTGAPKGPQHPRAYQPEAVA